MDARPTSKGSAGADHSGGARTHIKNRAATPYGKNDIPPFDDTTGEPIGEGVYEKLPKRKASSSRSSSGAKKRSSSASAKGGKTTTGATSRHTPKAARPMPAELAYRMQPWLVLGVGLLFAVMLVLSASMSAGAFDWTPATHPFRFVGFYTERVLFGILGVGAYLLPAAMIYLSVEHLRQGKDDRGNGRGLLTIAVLLLFSAMVHTGLIEAGAQAGALNTWNPKVLYAFGAARLGGGVLGGWLGCLLHVALGVIGTMIVGGALMIVLLMLLLGVTPRSIWQAIVAWRQSRCERAEVRDQAKTKEMANGQLMLTEVSRTGRTAEAEASVHSPSHRPAEMPPSKEEQELYLDPTRALLAQGRNRKRTPEPEPVLEVTADDVNWDTPKAAPRDATPEDVFSPDWTMAQSTPMEQVSELTPEQVERREQAFAANRSAASMMSDEEEQLHEQQDSATLASYPAHAEIDLDDRGAVISPLEAPIGDEPERTTDYQGGFDYSMDAETSEDEEEQATTEQTLGGVEVRVQRLSDEERERGQRIAPAQEQEDTRRPYVFPTVDLMSEPRPHNANKEQEVRAKMQKLRDTLVNFKVNVDGISYVCGPSVTRYEVRPAPGVRVKAVAGLADDIAMSLAAQSIRIEAPIPGKSAVGIEVPNTTRETVSLRPLIDSEEFRSKKSKVTACLGQDVAGTPILFDIAKMPHLLVAGTTNSGKSVCINSIVMSLLYKSTPEELKFIMIDPKQVEFTVYKDIPHLMAPIVCDAKRAAAVLNLAVLEMEKRFQMIREVGMKNIAGYNEITATDRYEHPYMPYIVIVIDELAELMMQARDEVETSIVRLAQKARAAGMHLIIGTQRPSVDVITGLIKSNVPSRIAFTVASQVDSRTILDNAGAEKLLGMGDMLYAPVGSPKPLRVQGAFVSDDEVERIINFIKRHNDPVRYDQEFLDNIDREAAMIGSKRQPDMDDEMDGEGADGADPKFYEAVRIAVENKRISTSLLQRMLSIGYGRAAKIIDHMEAKGFVGPAVGNKPREIRITEQAFAELMMNKEE